MAVITGLAAKRRTGEGGHSRCSYTTSAVARGALIEGATGRGPIAV